MSCCPFAIAVSLHTDGAAKSNHLNMAGFKTTMKVGLGWSRGCRAVALGKLDRRRVGIVDPDLFAVLAHEGLVDNRGVVEGEGVL